jgi:hypothetical protein
VLDIMNVCFEGDGYEIDAKRKTTTAMKAAIEGDTMGASYIGQLLDSSNHQPKAQSAISPDAQLAINVLLLEAIDGLKKDIHRKQIQFVKKLIAKRKTVPHRSDHLSPRRKKKGRFPFPDGSPHRARPALQCISHHPRRFSDATVAFLLPFPHLSTITTLLFLRSSPPRFPLAQVALFRFPAPKVPFWRTKGTFSDASAPANSADGGERIQETGLRLALWGNIRASTLLPLDGSQFAVRRSLRGWFSLIGASCQLPRYACRQNAWDVLDSDRDRGFAEPER